LIHESGGGKISKRNQIITDISYYKNIGFLNKSVFSYLLRLGWSHGNEEIISKKDAIRWFDTKNVGKSPAKFDIKKLIHVSKHYIVKEKSSVLFLHIISSLDKGHTRKTCKKVKLRIIKGMSNMKKRSISLKSLEELAEIYMINTETEILNSLKTIKNSAAYNYIHFIKKIIKLITNIREWNEDILEKVIRKFCQDDLLKIKDIAQLLRISLTYKIISPSIFEIMYIIGRKESIRRIRVFLYYSK
jgi:glutamyl-tRNA synthetase